MHWIYLIHEFHNLSWITEINELFHDILIYWDAPVSASPVYLYKYFLKLQQKHIHLLKYIVHKVLHNKSDPYFYDTGSVNVHYVYDETTGGCRGCLQPSA